MDVFWDCNVMQILIDINPIILDKYLADIIVNISKQETNTVQYNIDY